MWWPEVLHDGWFKGKYIKVDVNEEGDREQNRTVFGSFDTSEPVRYFLNAVWTNISVAANWISCNFKRVRYPSILSVD